MVYEFKFPDIGEGIQEGEVVEWLVREGDHVSEHQVLGKIETDKAVAEMPSPRAGIVLKIHAKPGEVVKVGQTLVTIGEAGEKASAAKHAEPVKPAEHHGSGNAVVGQLEEAPEEEEERPQQKAVEKEPKGKKILATPAVRALAKQLNVDLENIGGTGDDGRLTEDDVKNSIPSTPLAAAEHAGEIKPVRKYDMWGFIEHVPLKGIRKSIAKHMSDAVHNAAYVSSMDEADVTDLWNIREHEKVRAEKQEVHLTFLPFIVKAVIAALKEYPLFNAAFDEEAQETIVKKYYNMGIAVDTPDGLIVPVVKGADSKTVIQIAKEIEEYAKKARDRKIDLGDLKGGTFAITNIGVLGGMFFTPIPNYPDVAILGVGRIYDKAVVIDKKITTRKVMPLSFTFDHRVQDGADAARFINTLKSYLEDIDRLLVGD